MRPLKMLDDRDGATARQPDVGSGGMEGVVFRDPPPANAEAARLRAELAQLLVGAPTLPVALPALQMSLVDVVADGRVVDLMLGPREPVARLRMTSNDGQGADVAVEALQPSAERLRPVLAVLAQRLGRATTPAKWEKARALGRALARLPVGVPLAFFRQIVQGVEPRQALVRTGFRCNQDCGICWQSREWGGVDAEQVLVWIEDLRRAGAVSLLISGGEPTLDPELARYIERARALGYADITLETNAIQLSKAGQAARLREAGLSSAFVSLHSGDAAISDAITRAPGTHGRTVQGVRALLEAGVPVLINTVLTAEGLEQLGALPDFIHDSFGAHPQLRGMMISYPTDSYDRSLTAKIIPDRARLSAVLTQAIDRAFALGIRVQGLDGPCGPPLCTFGADRRVTALRPVPGPLDFRRHLPACDGCIARGACFGVRRADIERFGDACVSPLSEQR